MYTITNLSAFSASFVKVSGMMRTGCLGSAFEKFRISLSCWRDSRWKYIVANCLKEKEKDGGVDSSSCE